MEAEKMKKLYVVMWISLAAMIVMNMLANIIPLNGQTTGEISHNLNVLFTPAGYVFSIWGLIYVALIVWMVLIRKEVKQQFFSKTIGIAFIISCIFNIAWLISWHFLFFKTSIVFMILLLMTLITIYVRYTNEEQRLSKRIPFSIYLAWISVATIANISYVLKYNDVSLGVPEVMGTFILVLVAALLALAAVQVSKDLYFVGVVVWALIGVSVANTNGLLVTGTGIVVGVLIIASILLFMKHYRTKHV